MFTMNELDSDGPPVSNLQRHSKVKVIFDHFQYFIFLIYVMISPLNLSLKVYLIDAFNFEMCHMFFPFSETDNDCFYHTFICSAVTISN